MFSVLQPDLRPGMHPKADKTREVPWYFGGKLCCKLATVTVSKFHSLFTISGRSTRQGVYWMMISPRSPNGPEMGGVVSTIPLRDARTLGERGTTTRAAACPVGTGHPAVQHSLAARGCCLFRPGVPWHHGDHGIFHLELSVGLVP